MSFNSHWLENAEAPYAYVHGVGVGVPIADLSLNATLGGVVFSGTVNAVTGVTLSLNATLSSVSVSASAGPGVTVYEATFALVNAGLNVFITRERSNTIPYDYVIDWNPAIGTEVPPYTEVTLTVSDGPVNPIPTATALPNVTGITSSAAVAILSAGGWSAGEYTWAIDSSDAGTVIGQSPAAGTPTLPGAIVTLTLSLGPTTIETDVPVPI
jgi:eukaryotic-like serine/threonine-protein kinase